MEIRQNDVCTRPVPGRLPATSAKVKGSIVFPVSRGGDLVSVKEKSGAKIVVDITDDTEIERQHGNVEFFRHTDMDVTALVPALTIEAEGVGNDQGQLIAKKIGFTPVELRK